MSLFDDSGRVLISPSRLKTWTECPMKWKSVYVDEIRTPPTPSLVFGSAIHKSLETFHRARWLGESISQQELESSFATALQIECNPVGLAHVEVNELEMWAQAKALIALYTSEFEDEKVAAAELMLSAPLVDETGEDLGATLNGVIDLITADRKVVDLKSSARTSNLFDLAIAHSVQLDAYRYLMLHSAGHEPNSVEIRMLVRKKQSEIQTFKLPMRSSLAPFLDLCRRYIRFVHHSEAVLPRPGMFCGQSCPAYVLCRAFHGLEVA